MGADLSSSVLWCRTPLSCPRRWLSSRELHWCWVGWLQLDLPYPVGTEVWVSATSTSPLLPLAGGLAGSCVAQQLLAAAEASQGDAGRVLCSSRVRKAPLGSVPGRDLWTELGWSRQFPDSSLWLRRGPRQLLGAEAWEGAGKGQGQSLGGPKQGGRHWVLHVSAPPAPCRMESMRLAHRCQQAQRAGAWQLPEPALSLLTLLRPSPGSPSWAQQGRLSPLQLG